MGNDGIQTLTMPKWGLSMTHGTVVEWLVPEGATVSAETQVLEVETDKITGCVESAGPGTLRRQVAQVGQQIPIGGLLGVFAEASIADSEIDRFVDSYMPAELGDDSTASEPAAEFVEVGGRTIRFLRRGERGSPLVLIHGFTGSLNSWLFNQTALAERHVVYALDLPGHGESAKDVGDGSLDALIAVFLGWLGRLELPPVHLVGHSLGGAVALGAARRSPERVLSCTLIASAALGPEIDAEYVAGVVHSTRRKDLKACLERLFASRSRVTRPLVDELLRFKRLDGVQQALDKIARSLVDDGRQLVDLRDDLAQLAVPVQVLWGDQDRIIPCSHATGLPPRVTVERFPGSGHMVHLEAAGEVNRLIARFVATA